MEYKKVFVELTGARTAAGCHRNLEYSHRYISNKTMHVSNGNIARSLKFLKLAHLNTRGGLKGTKLDELGIVLDKHLPDIFGVSEINHDERDNMPTSKLNYNFIPGFTYSDQKTRLGVFVKRGIVYKIRKDIMKKLDLPCVWLDVTANDEKIAVVNCYREFRKYKTDDSEESLTPTEQRKHF